VVSPSSWVARKKGYQDLNLTVQRPIEQNVWGNNGIFELMYLLRESRTLEKYEKYVSKFDYCIKQKTNTEVERLFWKTLKLNAPLYGADIEGSLMDPGTPWNLSELDTILKDGLNDQKLSGVNMPYLYVGGWKTMFGWHKEDLDLYSINFLHLGAPKYWYCIDVDSSEDFEKFTQK
jgi:jumonji domain-containing protein 2